MGRWAQAHRRGSVAAGATALEAPPAPVLAVVEGGLRQTASGLPDVGGSINLYRAANPEGPYVFHVTDAWAVTYDWGTVEELVGFLYYGTEVGNGVAYSGESAASNVVDLRL